VNGGRPSLESPLHSLPETSYERESSMFHVCGKFLGFVFYFGGGCSTEE
jgi:hypothetical protein